MDVAKELAERIVGKVQFYVTEERAFAPGIADGWPEVIQAPHTANGRLRKVLTADIVKEITSALQPQQEVVTALGNCEFAIRRFTHEDNDATWNELVKAADEAEVLVQKNSPAPPTEQNERAEEKTNG